MVSSVLHPAFGIVQRFIRFALPDKMRGNWFNRFGILIVLLSICAGVVTYNALTTRPLVDDTFDRLYWLVGIDLLLILTLTGVVGLRAARIWKKRQQRLAGANMHIHLVTTFSALAAIPTIFVAIFAVVFIHVGVQSWFGSQIRTAVNESEEIAQSYLQEHQQSIKADLLAMANDLNRESIRLLNNPEMLKEFFRTQVYLRNLSEAVLIDSSAHVIERGGISLSLEFLPSDFKTMVRSADAGEVVLSLGENTDRVRALVKLDNYVDMYLFVGRSVDENVLMKISKTTQAADAYQNLERKQSRLKLTMTAIFTSIALMLLLIAVWSGLALADRIVDPVTRLIQAAERVRAGDLNARVEDEGSETEFGILARAFNRMTDQLSTQRRDLIQVNRQLDERRRFSETVLAGVNAGVLGMDGEGVIQVANDSAQRLFGTSADHIVGRKLLALCPEMEKVRRVVRSKPGRSVEIPIDVGASHWIVRMTAEGTEGNVRGYVATFDDLSPLMDAQRKAAWADVARRVAHEIKNPLTPIQLSAERLKKRYSKQITEDVETFENCTETIIRHVEDIRHMVDEFSAFARMPAAVRKMENMLTICQQVLVLFQEAHKQVGFVFDRPDHPVMLFVDRQQISQALTNLVKNAFEAVTEKRQQDAAFQGRIVIRLSETEKHVVLTVADNGPGWPADLMPRLTTPYVTTKPTGNGLGLAIVSKIVEDHNATLEFTTNDNQDHASGAIARITFLKGEKHHG